MKIKRLLLISTILIIAFTTTIGIYTYTQMNKIKNVKISKKNEDLGIDIIPETNGDEAYRIDGFSEVNTIIKSNKLSQYKSPDLKDEKYISEVKSIALFGVDVGRDKYDVPHSDSIIIVTIDPERNKIKLSSIMRDTYVKIKGHGKSKISDAYALGGPQLAIRTINENFGLNVRDYATVNFFTLEKVIDTFGGVTLDVKAAELDELNFRVVESAELQNKKPTLINRSGLQTLNGIQAVAYCRIRKVGSGDFERTSRQRVVLRELIKKAQSFDIIKFHLVTSQVFPSIQTSLSTKDIIKLGSQILVSGISEVEQQRFPLDGYCRGEIIGGVWYLAPKPSISATKEHIVKYIFEDIKPVSKKPLF
jgi:LCP family protein required for cell wall assembly